MTKDLFDEFDEALGQLNPKELEALELGIPPDEHLDASLVAPDQVGAKVLDPASGRVGYAGQSWRNVPMPVRLKAFYAWLDLGDFVKVASALGIKVSTVRHLHVQDQWLERANQLRVGLDHSISTLWSESRRAGLSFFLEYLACLDPAKMAVMSEPQDVAKMMSTILGLGAGSSQHIEVHGPAQIVAPGSQAQMNNGQKPASSLSDAELLAEAQRLGVKVQPSVRRARSESEGESGPSPALGEGESKA